MNEAHLHLLMNHLPVIGSGFGLAFLFVALVRHNRTLYNAAMAIIVFCALATIPVFLTGEPAEEIVEHLPGVTHDVIEEHEEAAKFALIGVEIVGALALVGGFRSLRGRPLPNGYGWVVFVGLGVVTANMLRTANLGGQIRHTEIRSTSTVTAPGAVPDGTGEREDDRGRGRTGRDGE